MPKHFIVAGASGLVGRETIRLLASMPDVTAIALVRKPGLLAELGLQQVKTLSECVLNYDSQLEIEKLGTSALPCDIFLCCLGSTIQAAGSQEAFKRIEHDYPVACLNALKKNAPNVCYAFVSSLGASPTSAFYLANKFAVESKIRDSGLCFVIARPSLLLGNRKEFRLGERIAEPLMRATFGLLKLTGLTKLNWLAKAQPIAADAVAKALVVTSLKHSSTLLEGKDLLV